MTPRQNLLSLYRRQGCEFAPVEFNLSPAMREKMRTAIGDDISPAEYFGYPEGFARRVVPSPPLKPRPGVNWQDYYSEALDQDTWFNPYGVAYEGGYQGAWHLRRMHHPMADYDSLEQMEAYPWPEWDCDDIAKTETAVSEARADGTPTIAELACTIWETAWGIRDMTALMMDMATDDEKAVYVLDRVTENSVKRAAAYGRAGADILHLGDDIGMQDAPMMSLDMYRTWLKPRLTRVIGAAREHKPDILVMYHSCGFVEPFIPDLIEAGIDILNPVQPESMDFGKLHAEYGDVLSFNGTLGTQTTLPFGTPDEVRAVVKRNLDIAGDKGGLVVAPTHVVEPEVPWENIEAYVKACKE